MAIVACAGADDSLLAQTTLPQNTADPGILVLGQRELRDAVPDVVPQRSVDADGVAAYGASTIRDVLAELAREEGDDEEPVVFVNGVPIEDIEDIADFPVEALERVDVLPRGAGVRAGGKANQRAFNVVLKKQFRTLIGTAGYGLATEGGWSTRNGEAVLTRIAGRQRLNVTLRAVDESLLLESERGIRQPDAFFPFAGTANIIPDPLTGSAEIDPLLSAAVGRPVPIVGLAPGNTNPSFADMVAGAFQRNETTLGDFRSLRPASRTYEAAVNYSQPVSSWINLTANLRAEQKDFDGLAGLPAGLFILPVGHPQSPFATPVAAARLFEGAPLQQDARLRRANVSLGLNGQRGKWQLGLRGDYRFYEFLSETDRQLAFPGQRIVLGPLDNPFAPDIARLVPTALETAISRSNTSQLTATANGPIARLPAGPVRLGLNGDVVHRAQSGFTEGPFFTTNRSFDRTELIGRTSLDIPLTSRENAFIAGLGDTSATLNYGVTDVPSLGTVERSGVGLTWQPAKLLQFQFALDRDRELPDVGSLGGAVTISENVRFFDFLTSETIDIIQISGGNPDLRNERTLRRRLSVELRPWQATDLRVTAEHLLVRQNDPIAQLPPASLDLLLAFPDRFVRDASGRLVSADVRPINFVTQQSEQFRWALFFSLPPRRPVDPSAPPQAAARRGRPTPLRAQFDLAHTINLKNEVVVREGFPVIDILDGGAVGFGGSLPRHQVTGSVNIGNSLGGVRIAGSWRGESTLRQGGAGNESLLTLQPFAVFNLRSHLELDKVWPQEKRLKGTRVSLTVTNLFNTRQQIVDQAGDTPLRFQPAYRDPIGRSVLLELRRTF
jgi:iron complex outermembrane recepter protein